MVYTIRLDEGKSHGALFKRAKHAASDRLSVKGLGRFSKPYELTVTADRQKNNCTCGTMTNRKTRLVAALCSLVILTGFIGSTQSWSCCLTYAKRPYSCKRLLAYSIQTINDVCDINAIIFHLPNGRFVCADPLENWTQRGMKCVDSRRKKEEKVLKEASSGNSTTTS